MRHVKAWRWHIDQITARAVVRGAWIFPGGNECRVAALFPERPAPVERFGGSDCRSCLSHLLGPMG
jgi:Uri superfamily endonuclease